MMIWLYRLPLLPLLGLFLIALCGRAYGNSVTVPESTAPGASPEKVVEGFYRWYLHKENYALKTPAQKATFRRYVTSRLRRRVAVEREVNIFLSAQNIDPGWEENITVSETLVRQEEASVMVTLTGEPREDERRWVQKLKVRLRREGGAWKIDDVLLTFSSEENQ